MTIQKSRPAMTPRSSRRKPIKVCLLLGGLTVGLLLGEACVRWLELAPSVQAINLHDPKSPYQRSTNPILRYELRPGFSAPLAAQHQYLRMTETEFAQDSSSAVAGTITVNSHGLRDVERDFKPSESGQRIILLGDSVVEMINYVSDESTISRLLEQKFDDGTEVLNVGTAGYCTRAEVELLRQKGLPFQPDIVVVMFVENDYWGYNLEHAIGTAKVERPAIVNNLFMNSDLFRIASLRTNLFGFADEQDPGKWHREAVGENNVVSGFELLHELSRTHDFSVIVALWPSFLKDAIGYRYVMEGTGDLVVEPIAWKFDFPTARLDHPFREHWKGLKPQPQPEWYYTCGDGMHPSVKGCEIAANALHGLLLSHNSFDAAPLPVTQPSGITNVRERFKAASKVAAMLALEPEVATPLADQISTTMIRQNRFVDAENFTAAAGRKTPEELNAVLASPASTTESYFNAGVQFVSTSQFFAARDMFERVAALDDQHVPARLYLADILLQMDLPARARRVLDEVIAIEPENAEAKSLLRNVDEHQRLNPLK